MIRSLESGNGWTTWRLDDCIIYAFHGSQTEKRMGESDFLAYRNPLLGNAEDQTYWILNEKHDNLPSNHKEK